MNTPSPVESVFFAALGKKTTAERADYLDHACRGDAELRRGVERLLMAYPQAAEVMARPAVERPGGGAPDREPHPPDRYPELAQEIRELFPAMVQVEQAEGGRQVEEEKKTGDSRTANSPLRQIGDYRILREIGRGGMGVVYEAEQISLGRRVALKVLPRQVAGDRLVQERFRREARAAARLHHTNIVPVFEVGQDEEVRFYAMQFIQGQGLDRVIIELQQLRDRGGSEHKTKAASLGKLLRPRRHPERLRQDMVAPTIAAGAEVSEVLRSILIGRFEPGSRASEPEQAAPSMLGSTRNGNLATATPGQSSRDPIRRRAGGHPDRVYDRRRN